MEEAKFSFNVKFIMQGFECQFTLREDQPSKAGELIENALKTINYLVLKGAAPKFTNGNGEKPAALAQVVTSQAPQPAPKPQAAKKKEATSPVCPRCGSPQDVELIRWEKDSQQHQAYKCQSCKEWLPSK